MTFNLLSYDDYHQFYISHPSQRQQDFEEKEIEWEKLHKRLKTVLSGYGRYGLAGDVQTDFFIGDDWFGDCCFHVVVSEWNLLSKELLLAVDRFVQEQPAYTVTIARHLPEKQDRFEVFITKGENNLRFFEMDLSECREAVARHPVLSKLGGSSIGFI